MKKLSLLFLILCMGCQSAQNKNTGVVEDPNIPKWLDEKPPSSEIWGIGKAFELKDFEAMVHAEELAKVSIREQLQHHVEAMLDRYEQEGNELNPYLKSDINLLIEDLPLDNAEVNLRWQAPNNIWWYRLSCSKESMRSVIFGILDGQVANYPDFNPNIAIVYFDEQNTAETPPIVTAN